MYNLSPDLPLSLSAAAAAGGACGWHGRHWRGTVARGVATTAVTPASAAATQPSDGAPGHTGSATGRTAVALRRLPEFSCVAETPALFLSPGSRPREAQGQGAGSGGEVRQLFVAETPSDSAAAGTAGGGSGAPASASEPLQQAQVEAAAVPARQQKSTVAAAPTPAAAAVAVVAAGAAAPELAGLQLHLPQPVLQAVPCADGRHLALLLGNYAPAGEPADVLVLRLPDGPAAAAAAADSGRAAPGGGGGSGLQVVATVAVQRSRWADGLELTANCLQLANTDRAGLLLILSAALELSDQPTPLQAAILVLPLPAGSLELPSGEQAVASAPPRGRSLPAHLSVECNVPLTCVLLAGSGSLLASGDGGSVRRLDFDPLWRTYTWARPLLPATYRAVHFEDLQQLRLYRCMERGRQLLLGLSSSGSVALWDVASLELLVARVHATYRLRSLHPISMHQAGLVMSEKQRMAPAGGAAAGGAGAGVAAVEAAGCGTHLFVGLVEHRCSGEQRVAAVMLGASGLSISSSSLAAPPWPQTGRQQQQQRRQDTTVVALAGERCWLGTAAGEVVLWQASGGNGSRADRAAPGGDVQLCSGGSGGITSLCPVPAACSGLGACGGGWWLVATTDGGSCTLLAR